MLKNHQILQHVKNLEVITSIFITRKVRQTENELLFLHTWGNWSYKANNHSKIWRVFTSWIVVAKPTKHVLSHNTRYFISSVQFSVVSNSLRSHWLQHTRIPCPSPTPRVAETQVHRICDAIQPSHPLLSASPPAFNHFQHQGLFKVSVLCIRWPKYWNFSFSISPSNEYSGLISFRIYWLDLLSDQGTLKSLLQHHTSKASILLRSAFFIVQLSVLHNVDLFGNTISPKLK